MHKNYMNWMQNTLSQEVEDWKKEHDPELDNDDCFHTSAPIIIYQMIDENLQVGIKTKIFFLILSKTFRQMMACQIIFADFFIFFKEP